MSPYSISLLLSAWQRKRWLTERSLHVSHLKRTASDWKDRRRKDSPVVVATPFSRLKHNLQIARDNGADFVVIDAPGKSHSAAMEAARAADLVLIPSRAQVFELGTLPGVRELLQLAGDPPTYVVLNGVHPRASKGAEEAKTFIQETFGFRACPVHLSQRSAYSEAPANGSTPQESDPDGAAAAELKALWKFVRQQLSSKRGYVNKESSEPTKHVREEASRKLA